MCDKQNQSARPGETRRQFIKKTGLAAAAIAGAGLVPLPISAAESNPAIAIAFDETDAVVSNRRCAGLRSNCATRWFRAVFHR